jgi:hypothetical protein
MFAFACVVCSSTDSDAVCLGEGAFACRRHSWIEVVRTRAVETRLRQVERDYYRALGKDPVCLVWASRALQGFRERAPATLRMLDGTRILVVYHDAVPSMFAVDRELGEALDSIQWTGGNKR